MGQLLLVRHGQASWGADDYDVLSEVGWEQSRVLGTTFRARGVVPAAVVIGGMRRHAETAQACAQAAGWSTPPVVDAGWDEYDHVAMLAKVPPPHDGQLTKREFQEWIEAGSNRWTEGAYDDYEESFSAFGDRVASALADLPREGTTVVFSSGGPISLVAASLLADDHDSRVALWRKLNVVCANSGVTRLIAGRRGTTLVSFNEHTHLDGTQLLSYR